MLSAAALAALGGCDVSAREGADAPRWRAEPVLTLGVESGDAVQEFGRVLGAAKLSDGRIAVADFGNVELRVFHPDGTHALTIGRRGNGPGEFTSLTRLAVEPGDTILAGGSTRVNRYAADGSVLGQQLLDWTGIARPPFFVESSRPLGGGAFLLYLIESSAGLPPDRPMGRSDALWLVVRGDREAVDTLGLFPALEQMSFTQGGERFTAIPLFYENTTVSINGRWVLLADNAADSVLRYDVATRDRRWVRVPLQRQPISDSALADAAANACTWASSADDVRRCEISVRRLPRQAHYPVFADAAVDVAGGLWLRTYPDSDARHADWLVVDDAGTPLARVALPSNLRIMQIGDGWLLGVTRDERGVERVVEFRITARARAGG